MSSIFLSHNHADKPFVRRLAQDLQAAGVRVWLDEAEMNIGDSLIEKIREGIDQIEYLGVVLSQNSVESQWVKREVDLAMNQEIEGKRVRVLPLVIDDCELPGFLKGKLYANFRAPNQYTEELAKILRRLSNTNTLHRNLPMPQPDIPEFRLEVVRRFLSGAFHQVVAGINGLVLGREDKGVKAENIKIAGDITISDVPIGDSITSSDRSSLNIISENLAEDFKSRPRSRRRPLSATQHHSTTLLVGISWHCNET
jgi:hypothetical protein